MQILLIVLLLVLVNAVFVAAEFATVSVRRVRMEQLAKDGNPLARRLLPHIKTPGTLYRYMAACQVAITASSLFLGAFGQERVAAVLSGFLEHLPGSVPGTPLLSPAVVASVSATLVLLGLTLLQVVLGELVPKSVAMRFPEPVALGLTWLVDIAMLVFSVFIDILNRLGNGILGLLKVPSHTDRHVHSSDEIERLIIQGKERGSLEEEEHRRLRRVLRFGERRVREVMVPRTRIRSISAGATTEEVLATLAASPFTRLPVYEGDLDHIVGLVHVKDLAIALARDPEHITLASLVRSVPSVPFGLPADDVLAQLRRDRAQMAIILDEYGGTAGLVTMEDLVEEVLGEVQDEFDREAPSFQRVSETEALVKGDYSLADLRDELSLDLEDEEVHSVGGLVMKLAGRAPAVGDRVQRDNVLFNVEEVRGHHVARVRVTVTEP